MTNTQRKTQRIQELLLRIEREQNVRIVYACESGSRAWGFASEDSDWDVRFLYIRNPEWYMRAFAMRNMSQTTVDGTYPDTITYQVPEEVLDAHGWDMTKTVSLLNKSNAALFEWMFSPIVYRQNVLFLEYRNFVTSELWNPVASFFHYRSTASRSLKEWLMKPTVAYKRYLYAIRPLMCASYVAQFRHLPPVNIHTLMEELEAVKPMIVPPAMLEYARAIIADKQSGHETMTGPAIPELNDIITRILMTPLAELTAGDPIILPEKELDRFERVLNFIQFMSEDRS